MPNKHFGFTFTPTVHLTQCMLTLTLQQLAKNIIPLFTEFSVSYLQAHSAIKVTQQGGNS